MWYISLTNYNFVNNFWQARPNNTSVDRFQYHARAWVLSVSRKSVDRFSITQAWVGWVWLARLTNSPFKVLFLNFDTCRGVALRVAISSSAGQIAALKDSLAGDVQKLTTPTALAEHEHAIRLSTCHARTTYILPGWPVL